MSYETRYIEVEGMSLDGIWINASIELGLIVIPPFNGSPHLCDSDHDYYGYTEVDTAQVEEYDIFNEDGDTIDVTLTERQIDSLLDYAIIQFERS